MKTLMFATDGSKASEQAALVTTKLLDTWPDAQLTVMYVSVEPAFGYEISADDTRRHENQVAAQIEKQVRERVFSSYRDRVSFMHETGSPARAICETAKNQHTEMIILGSHGHGRLDRMLLGSVSREVSHRTNIPVMVVPNQSDGGRFELSRVLFATDGSPGSEEAEELVIHFMSDLPNAQLVSMYVKDDVAYAPYGRVLSGTRARETAWSAQLQEKLTKASFAFLGNRHRYLEGEGDPAPLICEAAVSEHADLIIMGSRGFGAVNQLLIGSVSRGVVNQSQIPVVIVKHGVPSDSH